MEEEEEPGTSHKSLRNTSEWGWRPYDPYDDPRNHEEIAESLRRESMKWSAINGSLFIFIVILILLWVVFGFLTALAVMILAMVFCAWGSDKPWWPI